MEFTLSAYQKDLKNIAAISEEEELRLFKKIARGDGKAKEFIIHAYLPLVVKIACRFAAYYRTSSADLVGEGNIGLLRAVDKFDYTMGQRFGKYASWWIKWTICRTLINYSKTIHIPVYMAEKISRWKKTSIRLANTLQRPPDRNEIAKELHLSEKHARRIEKAIQQANTMSSTNQSEDDSRELSELIPDDRIKMPDEELIESYDKRQLKKSLTAINRREASVLKMRYGLDGTEPMTLQEISKKLKVSREWVRKLEKKAISELNRRMACTCNS